MNKKSILTSIIGIILFSIVFGYSLVFAGTGIFDNVTKIVFKLSDNVYLDSISLSKTNVLFKSGENLSDYKIKSECNIFSKLTYTKSDYYMFELKFFDNDCKNENFILINNENEIKYHFKLNIVSEYDALSQLLDLKSTRLVQLNNILEKKELLYEKYFQYDRNIEENYYIYLKNNRILKEVIYNKKIISSILEKRDEKYIVPVIGRKIDLSNSKIPNAGRPYRASYTDGIHHGWDVAGNLEEQVVALQDGIIIRVVSDFDYSNLASIKKGNNLTNDDKIRNLDILRGKQVWLKTMSGDVVFYSHLTDIFTNVKVGEVVRKKQPLGTIGITGVPDKKYNDYHLHFVIHRNPFISTMVGEYDIEDYMKWDWMFKGKNKEFILNNQDLVFES